MFASFLHDKEWLGTQELLQRHRWPEAVQNKNTVSLSPRLIFLSTCQSLEQNPLLRKQSSNSSVCSLGSHLNLPGKPIHLSFGFLPTPLSQPAVCFTHFCTGFYSPQSSDRNPLSPHNFLCFNTKAVLKVWLPGHRLPRPSALSSSDTLQSPMLSNFLQ